MQSTDTSPDTTTASKQPKWLRRLERESWQAELIISGLAIYGSLKIPEIIFGLIDFLISHLSLEQYYLGYWLSYLLILGASLLTTIFIIHFILRGYWIGLIGLNSVFPDGYKLEDGYYSAAFMKEMTKDLPSIKTTIGEIDNKCSTLFASACSGVMVYFSFAIVLAVLLFLASLLDDYVSNQLSLVPLYLWIGILIIQGVSGMLFNSKKLKANASLQTRYAKIVKTFSPFITPGLHKPLNQILYRSYTLSIPI